MKNLGIIMEANPFHKGHFHLIEEIKKIYKPDLITIITSTSFTMRGEISVINKFDKVKYLLDAGANLVCELPAPLALQSADFFSSNAVRILNDFKVTDIVCGSETGDEKLLDYFYHLINDSSFNDVLKEMLNQHLSYKNAFTRALEIKLIDQSLIELFNSANFTLAFNYYKAIKDNNLNINLHLYKRDNQNYPSARKIIDDLRNDILVSDFLPFKENLIDVNKAEEQVYLLMKDLLIRNNYDSDKEGILNYLSKIEFSKDYVSFLQKAASAKLTKSTIRRILLKTLLNIDLINKYDSYTRVLGFDPVGEKFLGELKDLDLFSRIKEQDSSLACLELEATKLYAVITNNLELIKLENHLPIKKGY